MSSADSLRKYLYNNGFKIISETAVYDANRVYSVLLVKYDGNIKPVPLRKIFIGELEYDLSTAATDYIKRQYNILAREYCVINLRQPLLCVTDM
jgi:tRNA A22 N-methylase